MDKQQLLQETLEKHPLFGEYPLESLYEVASFIGRHLQFLQRVYKVFSLQTEETVELQSLIGIGPPVLVHFQENYQKVSISRGNITIQLDAEKFSVFLDLINVCLMTPFSVGTVVQLDRDFLSGQTKELGEDPLAMIVGAYVMLEEEGTYVDYLAELWPLGQYMNVPTIATSNFMIKQAVHQGYTNDLEKQLSWKVKQQVLEQGLMSVLSVKK